MSGFTCLGGCGVTLASPVRGPQRKRCAPCNKQHTRARLAANYRKNYKPKLGTCVDCKSARATTNLKRCDACHLEWEGDVIALRQTGATYRDIASVYGVSYERIRQIVAELAPHLTGSQLQRRRQFGA